MLLQKIIEGCKQNNPASQKELYQHCFSAMMKVCVRYNNNMDDAGACYNAAMHTAFVKINQYKNEGEFLGWVRKIVVNTCLNNLKQQTKFETKELTQTTHKDFYIDPDIYSSLQSKEILQLVRTLPQNTALVFNLYVMENYTHEQIATELQIAVGTSKWHLNNARTLLKEKIKTMQLNEYRKNA